MRIMRTALRTVAVAVGLFIGLQASASQVMQFNLNEMTDRAALVVRGEVIEMRQVSIEAGGGTIPAIHYTVRVDDTLKGTVNSEKDVAIVEFTILGSAEKMKARQVMDGFPIIQAGREYLLFVGQTSSIGLTTTVGLNQGKFDVVSGDKVVNGMDNVGLFNRMNVDFALRAGGPVSYDTLAGMVRARAGN